MQVCCIAGRRSTRDLNRTRSPVAEAAARELTIEATVAERTLDKTMLLSKPKVGTPSRRRPHTGQASGVRGAGGGIDVPLSQEEHDKIQPVNVCEVQMPFHGG